MKEGDDKDVMLRYKFAKGDSFKYLVDRDMVILTDNPAARPPPVEHPKPPPLVQTRFASCHRAGTLGIMGPLKWESALVPFPGPGPRLNFGVRQHKHDGPRT
jgi:hypothetical protein